MNNEGTHQDAPDEHISDDDVLRGIVPWSFEGLQGAINRALRDAEIIELSRLADPAASQLSQRQERTFDMAKYLGDEYRFPKMRAYLVRLMRIQAFVQEHCEKLVEDGFLFEDQRTGAERYATALFAALAVLPYSHKVTTQDGGVEYHFSYEEVAAKARELFSNNNENDVP